MMSPLYFSIVRFSQIQISLATWLISRMSWLTRTRPPSNSLTAFASASIPSMSRWFVGSSSKRIWGTSRPSFARTTRDFWPSDSSSILRTCIGPLTPNRPKYLRWSSRGSFGYRLSKNSRGVLSRSRTSTKCWVNRPSLRCPWGRMSPSDGLSSPAISLTRVVFPAPFGPTSATRESRSTPKLTLVYRGWQPGYPKETSWKARTGGGRCPGSVNLKLSVFSSSGFGVRPARIIFCRTFSLDWACFAFFAVP
mmetsp:Transcript_17166/g.39643  ORF Transcript_17166/g.39643 Transcript_17166/m.39643 type:complete len:251 (-) Transcript_17166:1454-2206(-)